MRSRPAGFVLGELPVAAEHPEQGADLVQCLPRGRTEGVEFGAHVVVHVRKPIGGALCLHDDHRHVVGDDVVQVACDVRLLLEDGATRTFELADLLLPGELPSGDQQPAHQQPEDDDGGDTDAPSPAVAAGNEGREQQDGRDPHDQHEADLLADRNGEHQRKHHQDVHDLPRIVVAGNQVERYRDDESGRRGHRPPQSRPDEHEEEREHRHPRDQRQQRWGDVVGQGQRRPRDRIEDQRHGDHGDDAPPSPAQASHGSHAGLRKLFHLTHARSLGLDCPHTWG